MYATMANILSQEPARGSSETRYNKNGTHPHLLQLRCVGARRPGSHRAFDASTLCLDVLELRAPKGVLYFVQLLFASLFCDVQVNLIPLSHG